MYSYVFNAVVGAFVTRACVGYALGFVILPLVSMAWGGILSRTFPAYREWVLGVLGYCTSTILFSGDFFRLCVLISNGDYYAALWILPELVLTAVFIPLLGLVVARFFQMIV
jgi:hypothetical protein